MDDLDQTNPKSSGTTDILNESDCKSFLAKIYSGFGLSSNIGPTGEDDLPTFNDDGDQGSLVFLRGLFSMQEFPTDESVWNWKDVGIVELVSMNWDYTTKYSFTFYQRAMLNVRYCKEFLDVYTEDLDIPNIKQYRDEVRAIRALNYFYLIDLFGNPGVVWDDSPVGDAAWMPTPIGRAELFEKVEDELIDLSENSSLPEQASMATYGKMTKPVVWTILAKMYLNAEVYTKTAMYDKAQIYCEKVIGAGYGLENNYSNLFCAENHKSPLNGNEIIFPIICDADNAKSYGGTIMMITGAFGGELNGNWFGSNNAGWTCLKPTEVLIAKFDNVPDAGLDRYKSNTKIDKRYKFFDVLKYDKTGVDPDNVFDPVTGIIKYEVSERRNVETKLADWDAGYLCYKFTNLNWDGVLGDITEYPNTDFPLFRLADIYLMYAECAIRGYGSMDIAEGYVNDLRNRAYEGNPAGLIDKSDLTLDFILDERARELYWECHRRTDLIRFGKFTQNYVWPYKGGTEAGVANVSSRFNLYPFSDKDLTSNPNLIQNPGYKSVR